mgnify:FL=1
MPSGTPIDEMRECKICGNKLRPLYKNEDWANRKYHVACFKSILKDIANYNEICYKKYNHRKKVHDVFVDEMKPDHKFVVTWD